MAALMREKSRLFIDEDGILVRKTATRSQRVLPKKFHALIYRELHEDMGHLGVECTLHLVPVLLAAHATRHRALRHQGMQQPEAQEAE